MAEVIKRWRHIVPDLTIICKDGKAKAIRTVLVAASSVFTAMLAGQFIEGGSNMINMPDDYVDIVQAAINYIQYGDAPKDNPEDIVIFLDKYDVKITESEDDPLYKILMHLAKTRDGSIRTYSKILDTSLLPNLRKKLLNTINSWVQARFVMQCSSCNMWGLGTCNINCANMNSPCSVCKQYINDSCPHINCKDKPCGTWKVLPFKFNDTDYELIGRAITEYYGK